MDILENTVPKPWQEEIHRQRFDCTAKGQANSIRFCKCLESLDPSKQDQKGRHDAMSAAGTWQQILRKKRGQEADVTTFTENQAHKSKGVNTMNKCEVLRKQELNAIIGKSIKAALKKVRKDYAQQEEHNAIQNFDALSLSLSNDNDVNCT
eukprot:3540719-Ditylum_brightwellii.AAC.1